MNHIKYDTIILSVKYGVNKNELQNINNLLVVNKQNTVSKLKIKSLYTYMIKTVISNLYWYLINMNIFILIYMSLWKKAMTIKLNYWKQMNEY